MRSTLTAAAAALSALALAACSSATAGVAQRDPFRAHSPAPHAVRHTAAPASRTPASSAPAPYPSTTAPSRPVASSGASSGAPSGASDVDRALLVASDLGSGYAATTPDAPAALPCTPDRPPVDDQVRHVEKGNAVYVDDIAGSQVSEQIYVYRAPAQALRHQAVLDAGLSCRHGSLQGQPVTVLGPSDVRGQLRLHTDSAQVWIVHTGQFSGALVALRIHAVVVQFAVVARDGAESHLDVKKVVVAGLTKLYAVARG